MILAVAIVTGFQSQIRDKVIGFGSHIQINSFTANNSFESAPVLIDQPFYHNLDTVDGVRHIQTYATKTGIIQTREEIQGIVAKGVGADFDWSFFEDKIDTGSMLNITAEHKTDSILIPKYLANKLKLSLGDTMTTYFLHQRMKPKARRFIVGGIYETGLEEFDQQLIICDIKHIQKLNNWGVQAYLLAVADCLDDSIAVSAQANGMYQNYEYEWFNDTWEGEGPHKICPTQDTSITVVVTDVSKRYSGERTIPDTATLRIEFNKPRGEGCACKEDDFTTYLSTSGGSSKYYSGGFEVLLDDYDDLRKMDDIIYQNISGDFNTVTIVEQFREIFGWLEMIDVNVVVIIILMFVVAAINMSSTLLVLILEKTNMIGILKSMGHRNWNIRKVFLYNAAYLIAKGLFWGNLIGIILCLVQHYFGIIKLPQDSYYISTVPINLDWWHILFLNIGTILVCMWAMLAPSYLITRISPVKAIRFN